MSGTGPFQTFALQEALWKRRSWSAQLSVARYS